MPQTLRLLTLGSLVLSATSCCATSWLYWAGWRAGVVGLFVVDGLLLVVVSRLARRQHNGDSLRGAGHVGMVHRVAAIRTSDDNNDETAELL
eukprot:COSAG03_NODE_16182_length_409_cov_1.167742_1_plen_92_part_00